jgi:cation diffusion facilitator family transporter
VTTAHAHLEAGERRTRLVVLLSVVTMALELAFGWLAGSMALIADGWHMATHVGAVALAWLAYRYGRRAEREGRFAFGPAKVSALAGYTNALLLGGAALLLAAESIRRLGEARPVQFGEALPVAIVGLVVNVVAAFLLGAPDHEHHDHNLRAVYLHVLSDALTSVLAIAALVGGALGGPRGLDPAAGLLGAAMILIWAFGLVRRTASDLMDMTPNGAALRTRVVAHLEADTDLRIEDVRVWSLGGGAHGCNVRLLARSWRSAADIKERVLSVCAFAHVAVEIHADDWKDDGTDRHGGQADRQSLAP